LRIFELTLDLTRTGGHRRHLHWLQQQLDETCHIVVVGVLLFCLIQFSPMIIPLLCLELWPEGTKTRLRALNALRGRASILALRSM
jgi:hypothetical protein